MVWLTGGSLGLAILMIAGLLGLILFNGARTFWPVPVVHVADERGVGRMGEVSGTETYVPGDSVLAGLPPEEERRAAQLLAKQGVVRRRLLRSGNFDLSGQHFEWVSDFEIAEEHDPEWALVVERLAWGRFYGTPKRFELQGETVAESPTEVWRLFNEHHAVARERWRRQRRIETHEVGRIN